MIAKGLFICNNFLSEVFKHYNFGYLNCRTREAKEESNKDEKVILVKGLSSNLGFKSQPSILCKPLY